VRLFDHYDVSGVEQDAGGEIEALLRAAGNHDLVRLGHDPARSLEVFSEGGAQRRVPGRIRIAECVARRAPCPRGQQPPPDLPRELVDGRLAVAKVVLKTRRARGRRAQKTGQTTRIRRDGRRIAVHRARRRRHRGGRQRARHRGGRTVPADDIALGEQLLVGQHDGVAGHTEIRRELSRRRQAGARQQPPVADRRLERMVDASVQRAVRLAQIEQ